LIIPDLLWNARRRAKTSIHYAFITKTINYFGSSNYFWIRL